MENIIDILNEFEFNLIPDQDDIKKRKARIKGAFNKNFTKSPKYEGASLALVWALFGRIIRLYLLGCNSNVIIETHGLIEHFVLRDFPKLLVGKNPKKKEIIEKIIFNKTLKELSLYLRELDIWNNDDLSMVRKLCKLRDGIAHNNIELMYSVLGKKGVKFSGDARNVIERHDSLPYIVCSIKSLIKLVLNSEKFA